MEYLFYFAMGAVLLYITYRNLTLMKRYKHNKDYIDCYKQMLNDPKDSYETICRFIEEESSEEFRNKGRILKLYVELNDGRSCKDTLDALDVRSIFYKKDKPAKDKISLNSDIFVWLFLDMAKARGLSRFDVLNELYEKFKTLPEMGDRLEYLETAAIYNALCEQADGGISFLNDMLEGNYYEYKYEKNLIGLFKRFAAATLAYCGEPMDDLCKQDLHAFASTLIGKTYMKDLGIFEKYPPSQDETSTDEMIENKEE